jgi:hypothetical protein
VEKQPAEPVHWLNLGEAQQALGWEIEAGASFRQGLSRVEEQLISNPGSLRLRSLEALLAARAGDCRRAVTLAGELRPEVAGSLPELRRLAKGLGACGERSLAREVVTDLLAAGESAESLRALSELQWLPDDL